MHSNTPSRHLVRGLILTSLVSLVLLTVSASPDMSWDGFVRTAQASLGLASGATRPSERELRHPARIEPTLGVFNTAVPQPLFFAADTITSFGTPFTENFDGMGTSSTAALPGGFKIGIDWLSGASATT